MGTYNGRDRIERSITSIVQQTFKDWELLICDDCSHDGTFEFLKSKYKDCSNIKIFRLSKNAGLATALNECLKHAQGEYIARMDDDDYAHPNRLQVQYDYIESHPEFAVVGTSINYIDENGIYGEMIYSNKVLTKQDIFKGNCFVHPSVIMRKEALNAVGGYTISDITIRGQDYDLWCKLYAHGYKGINLEDKLLDYFETRDSIKRRKFIHDINLYKNKIIWRKKLNLPCYYDYYAYRCVITGLLPQWLYGLLRRIKVTLSI